MLVWEWMSHVSTEVCSNISNILFIIVRSFLFCCCGQTWSAQACISHVRCDLTTQLFKKVSSHEVNEFFLIWNFSCNFIIIICSFLSAKNNAICTLQINQEKHLILQKKIALCTLPIEWTFTCIQCEWGQTTFQNYLSIFPIPWPKSFQ